MRAAGELVEQVLIGGRELRQTRDAVHRFDLAKLRDDHGGAGCFQLAAPGTKIHIPPLFIHRVALPCHGTEPRFARRKSHCEPRLQFRRFLLPHKIALSGKNDRFIVAQFRFAGREGDGNGSRPLFPKAAEDFRLRRHTIVVEFLQGEVAKSDFGFAVPVNLQRDQSFLLNPRLALRIIDGEFVIEKKPDAGAFHADFIHVPFTGFFVGSDNGLVGCREHFVSPRFIIETA